MLEDVGQRLVNGQKQMVTGLRGERLHGHPGGDIQFALDACPSEVLLGILTDVGNQMVKSVFLRVDRPDHFVERPKHLAGIVGYGAYLLLEFNRNWLATTGMLT